MNISNLQTIVIREQAKVVAATNPVFEDAFKSVRANRSINMGPFLHKLHTNLKSCGISIKSEKDDSFGHPIEGIDGEERYKLYYPMMGAFCFEPDEDEFDKPAKIQIVMCLHPETNRMPPDMDTWQYFHFRFLKIAVHECVHRGQYLMGRHDSDALIFKPHTAAAVNSVRHDEQTYLGDIDEVEAYAREVVEEWHFHRPDTPLTPKAIKDDFINQEICVSLQYYHDTFEGNIDHPAVQRLFRKIKEWEQVTVPLALSLPKAPMSVRKRFRRHDGPII